MGQRILHLADLHLGFRHEYLGPDAEARAREADTVLDRVVEWLLGPNEEQIGALLLAGDIFHTPWPDDQTIERVIRTLGRLEQAGIAVVTVPGNHDELTYVDGVFRRWASMTLASSPPSMTMSGSGS